jgi:hypothetical protein
MKRFIVVCELLEKVSERFDTLEEAKLYLDCLIFERELDDEMVESCYIGKVTHKVKDYSLEYIPKKENIKLEEIKGAE